MSCYSLQPLIGVIESFQHNDSQRGSRDVNRATVLAKTAAPWTRYTDFGERMPIPSGRLAEDTPVATRDACLLS